MPKTNTILKIVFTVLVISSFVTFVSPISVVKAETLEEKLANVRKKQSDLVKSKQDIQGQIDKYNKEANSYNSQISTLTAQIDLLENDIETKQLHIEELDLTIDKLQDEIESSKSIISQTEFDIGALNEQVDSRIENMYLDYKTGIAVSEIKASLDDEDAFKKVQYKGVLVDKTRELMQDLDDKKSILDQQKKQLDDQNVQLQRDRTSVNEERLSLDSKKSEIASQRQNFYALQDKAKQEGKQAQNQYNVLSNQEAQARAEAESIESQIANSQPSVPNGSFVKAGTRIGYQGMTGIATGPHLHLALRINGQSANPCTKLPVGKFSNCGGDGTLRWPLLGNFYLSSSYGNRCYNHNGYMRCTFHDGIDLPNTQVNAPIYAAHDGWMVRGFEKCSGSLCNGGGTKYVTICQYKDNCNRGIKTSYLHLSSY